MVFLLRMLGLRLVRYFGVRAFQELRAGNIAGARRHARRAGVIALRLAGGMLLGVMLLSVLLIVLLVKAFG